MEAMMIVLLALVGIEAALLVLCVSRLVERAKDEAECHEHNHEAALDLLDAERASRRRGSAHGCEDDSDIHPSRIGCGASIDAHARVALLYRLIRERAERAEAAMPKLIAHLRDFYPEEDTPADLSARACVGNALDSWLEEVQGE